MTKDGRRRIRIAAGACALAVVLLGGKTKIVESEGDKAPQAGPARKILVLVVVPDPTMRADFEDVIAGELSLRGASAVAAHVSFPELPKDRGPFEAKLAEEGFDAVTVSRLVGMDDKLTWHEGSNAYTPEYLGSGVWGAYWYGFQKVTLPGYLNKETRVRVRTDFWRASGSEGRLAWSGTSESLDPLTAPRMAREVGAALAKALKKAKLL